MRTGIYGLGLPFDYGRLQQVAATLAQPAVATGYTRQVKGNYCERLVLASAVLVTDANVANRALNLEVQDADSNVVARLSPQAVQTAGLTWRYTWAVGVSASNMSAALAQLVAIPALILQPGWKYVWTITGVQAGDQLGALTGLVEQFPTGVTGYELGYHHHVDGEDT